MASSWSPPEIGRSRGDLARRRNSRNVPQAKDGNVVCFFESAQKFNTRYATFGFTDKAHLDEGTMWPVAFALTELTADEEARIGALVKKAVSSAKLR